MQPGDRGGSHSLIVGGRYARFTNHSFGGLIVADFNTVAGTQDVVFGTGNSNSGAGSVILGGADNSIVGGANVVLGSGQANSVTYANSTTLFGGLSNVGSTTEYAAGFGSLNGTVIGVNGIPAN
jgi:hypothetical protein